MGVKINKQIDLSNLPTKVNGKSGRVINWKESVGCKVGFIYGKIKGEIEIVKYISNRKIIIKYNNKIYYEKPIDSSHLYNCKIGSYIGAISKEFKIKIGDVFKDNKRDLIILKNEYRPIQKKDGFMQYYRWYKYRCNKCKYEGWIIETSLLKGIGCSCCSGKSIKKGINDIATTTPWMIDLGVNKNDAEKFTKSSNSVVEVICPNCKRRKNIKISDVYRYKSIGCICRDNVSYGEKIIASLLNQINIEFFNEHLFNWSNRRRYDFYIPNMSCIIEVHGGQHYDLGFSNFRRNIKEEQENDRFKKELALANNIKHYIELDCRESNLKWIKNSVLNSELNELFDLREINWIKCEEFALKNIVKEVCEYWNNKEEWESVNNIVENFKLSESTIRKYLKTGTSLGLCRYDPKSEKEKSHQRSVKTNSRAVKVYKNGILLGIFNSIGELSKKSEEKFGIRLVTTGVGEVCRGKRKQYKGFVFKYV